MKHLFNSNTKTFLIVFVIMFVSLIVFSKLIAIPNRFRVKFYAPLSWSEIFSLLPEFLLASLFISIIVIILKIQNDKMIGVNKNKKEKEKNNNY